MSAGRLVGVKRPPRLDHRGILVRYRASGVVVRHAHLSGCYLTEPDAFARYVRRVIVATRPHVVTTTEVYDQAADLAIRNAITSRFGDDFIIRRRGEFLVLARRARFTVDRLYYDRVTRVYDDDDAWRDAYRFRYLLTDQHTGDQYRHHGLHLPSGVEAGDRYRNVSDAQVAAHLLALKRAGRTIARERDRHPEWHHVAWGDTNTDYHRQAWRAHNRDHLGLPSCWDRSRPTAGTLGDRLVDVVHTDAQLVHA